MAEQMVRVLDTETDKITNIPASELAPGMIRVQVAGIEGDVWVDSAKLKMTNEPRHPPFGEALREELRLLQERFKDVYPRTLQEWEDGFRLDANPDKEIATWFAMADAFARITEGRNLYEDQKQDIFQVILAFVDNGAEYVSKTVSPATLSRKRVQEIVDSLRGMPSTYPAHRERVRALLGWKTTQPGELADCLVACTPKTESSISAKVIRVEDLVGQGPSPFLDTEARQALQDADVVLVFLAQEEGPAEGGPVIAFGKDAWQEARDADPPRTLRVLSVRASEGDELHKLLGAIKAVKGRYDWPSKGQVE